MTVLLVAAQPLPPRATRFHYDGQVAQNFLRTPPGGTLTRVRANGDVVRWHPSSNTFGVMDAGGAPRTFFRPDPFVHGYANNWDYFYAQ